MTRCMPKRAPIALTVAADVVFQGSQFGPLFGHGGYQGTWTYT